VSRTPPIPGEEFFDKLEDLERRLRGLETAQSIALLGRTILTAPAASISFPVAGPAGSNLLILAHLRGNGSTGACDFYLYVNNDQANNYAYTYTAGVGTQATIGSGTSGASSAWYIGEGCFGASDPGYSAHTVEIPDFYAGTTRKAYTFRSAGYNTAGDRFDMGGGRYYASASPISTITVRPGGGFNLDTDSCVSVYALL
jgi:hypothetical protein